MTTIVTRPQCPGQDPASPDPPPPLATSPEEPGLRGQHYFGYSYTSAGTLKAAKFTATANADLDCDTTLSTFERYGYGDESASHAECSMKGSSAFYKNNETE